MIPVYTVHPVRDELINLIAEKLNADKNLIGPIYVPLAVISADVQAVIHGEKRFFPKEIHNYFTFAARQLINAKEKFSFHVIELIDISGRFKEIEAVATLPPAPLVPRREEDHSEEEILKFAKKRILEKIDERARISYETFSIENIEIKPSHIFIYEMPVYAIKKGKKIKMLIDGATGKCLARGIKRTAIILFLISGVVGGTLLILSIFYPAFLLTAVFFLSIFLAGMIKYQKKSRWIRSLFSEILSMEEV